MAGNTLDKAVSGGLIPSSQESQSTGLSQILQSLLPQNGQSLPDAMTAVTQGINALAPLAQAQAEAIAANTQALAQNTVAQSSGGAKGVASTIGSAASTFLGSGLGLSPLLSGLIHLFTGGGQSETPPPLVKFALPPSISVNAANTPGQNGGVSGADYGQDGVPRAIQPAAPAPARSGGSGGGGQSYPPITVNVNAMDSKSFLDHSNDIAQAVREAMLNMHAINDVVNDL